MTTLELRKELDQIVRHRIMDPVLILGESGIGKTSIINQVAQDNSPMKVWDVRWSQLMPADARGVPVPRHAADGEIGTTVFYPPSFWPREGTGIIFLDEFNLATAAMMGLAQQLLLDRRFGDYFVPKDIFVWAAGNRKIDRAAVNEIPAPVNNRVAHYDVEHDLPSWEIWAHENNIDSRIVGFLKWRSELLHKFDPNARAWPSPRTWEMAHKRLTARMSIDPVVGESTADEFNAFLKMLSNLPNIELIASGRGSSVQFPTEPSLKYAAMAELTRRSLKSLQIFTNSLKWAIEKGGTTDPDWISFFSQDYIRLLRNSNAHEARKNLPIILEMPELKRFIEREVAQGGLV